MAIVVKWRADGEYLEYADGPWIEWTPELSRAKRFADQSEFRRWLKAAGLKLRSSAPEWWSGLRFVRLVPRKRHAPPQS